MATDKKTAASSSSSMILRLSRGRTLKVTFRPRIRLANILVKLLAAATGLFALSVAQVHAAPPLNALPTGGQVVYGSTSFQQTSNTLNVNQASQNTIINWQSFDIGAQSIVNFNQPNSSAVALNRILGDNASQIYGQLNANGHVFLLNPNGVLFAPGSQVNVGGLLASTMHMSDRDFISGNYRLTGAGAGFIDNQGNINANSIAFVGNNISNSGNLFATNVSLVAGDTVAVDITGNGLIRARVESPALQASISNSGNINAVQQVTMTAGQSRDTLNSLVNNSGIIRATGLSDEGGVITLQGGETLNSGVLDASSATGKGGTVAVLGEHVGIVESGSVIASGATGGGTILVGGDFQGNNPDVFNASRTYVGANTTLNADALNTGNGGKVIVWADDITRAYGDISARGGATAGNGGFVEVSGKHSLDYRANTDTRAANGQTGTLLLDPLDILIDTIGGGALVDVDMFATNPLATTIISNTLINNATSNVILQAINDITFNAAINMTNPNIGLTAQAQNNIIVNQGITTNHGNVILNSDADGIGGGTISVANADIVTNGGNIALVGGVGGAGFANSTISGDGINVSTATLNAGGGNITLRGRSETSDGIAGVFALDSTIQTIGTGTISIDGIGAPFSVQPARSAISMSNVAVSAVGGDITLTGTTTSNANLSAVRLLGGTDISNATGNIAITGHSLSTNNSGIAGVEVLNSSIQSNATGNVSLTGTISGSGDGNRGLLISGAGTTISATNGNVTLGGDASAVTSSFNSDGIFINAGAIIQSSGAGNILLSGKSATLGVAQAGIAIADTGTVIRNTGSGSTTINGQGNGTGTNSFGVVLFAGATVESTGTGNMNITAKANNTTSAGLAVDGPSAIRVAKNLTINAGNNSATSDQIRFQSANGANIQGIGTSATLSLNPLNTTTGIAVGGIGTTPGAFNLSGVGGDLDAINNFNNVTIGSAAHTGTYTVAAGGLDSFTAANNNRQITLQSKAALIDFLGATTFSGNLRVSNLFGNIALSSLNAINGGIGIDSNDNLTIKAGSTITANGNIKLVANLDRDNGATGGGDFVNLAGPGAISTTAGNTWEVYSHDVAGDITGGLVADFIQYNSHFGDAILSLGNGFIYGDPIFTAVAPPVLVLDSVLNPINDAQNDAVQDVSGQELVLIPVKTALLSEDEYEITTKTVGKELSCK
jgi:trimeric autotransporter adhesin